MCFAAEGQSDTARLSAAAAAPTPEALFRFQRPSATEAVAAASTGAPGSVAFLPRKKPPTQRGLTAASTEVCAGCGESLQHFRGV